MTSSEMPTRIAMPMPFASGASATRATIESASGDNLNYVDGFPGKYSLPASEGGKYVSRGEMNAIGNMASNDLHYFKCGGLNTFDADFCAAVGGYPKGAVLDYIVGYKLHKAISLVDNNSVNFIAKGIDGVNWQYLNTDIPDVDDESVEIGELESIVLPDSSGPVFLATYLCTKEGVVNITRDSVSVSETTVLENYAPEANDWTRDYGWSIYRFTGNALAYKIMTEEQVSGAIALPTADADGVNMNGWKQMPVSGFVGGGSAQIHLAYNGPTSYWKTPTWQNQSLYSPTLPRVQAGNYIAFCYIAGLDTAGTLVDVTSPSATSCVCQISANLLKFKLKAFIR